mmetsp:Transcript_112376/g.194219  ORF Transcript_112376/g.194219 Transcript_112376/m.194219 type:complete len:229 (-) Transcript_112376:186-872(-)
MMRSIIIVLACVASASQGRRMNAGFNPAAGSEAAANRPSSSPRSVTDPVMQSSLRESIMSEGIYEETNGKIWDPLGLSENVNDGTLAFFRACEIKHGRVAMLASLGYVLGAYGVTFPGNIAPGVSFASVNSDGVFNAWGKVPAEGRLQILTTILLIELYTEVQKPHYTKGGDPAKIPFIYGLGIFGKTADERLKKAEMKHGRAAMWGIISFLLHHNLPNAIPILPSNF